MDHRPFENWLLENKSLTASEKQQLQSHLRECPSCVALAEVDLALNSARMAAPVAGFTDRFQARLAARKLALRRRNAWGFVILTLSVLTLLAWIFWPALAAFAQAPSTLLALGFSSLTSAWTVLQAIFHAGTVLLKVMPDFVPIYIFPALLFIAGCFGLLWVFSLVKFTRIPQGA
jgi:hypothetical protein